MAGKDMTEKTLESYNDVFADIANGLLFHGDEVIAADDLQAETPRSLYKADGGLHEQERDVAKYWRNGTIRVALCGMENQTKVDADISLRVASYDGTAYRAQLLADKKKPAGKRSSAKGEAQDELPPRYPVITMVLYFGYEHHWDKPLSLCERLTIPSRLRPYVNDCHVNLFEIAYLSDKQVGLFKSDFRLVADYFVQMRKNKAYRPAAGNIQHVHEFLQLMSVMTNDHRFEEVYNAELMKEGATNMCTVLDQVENRGIEKGIEQGVEQGMEKGLAQGKAIGEEKTWVKSVSNLMQSMQMTAQQAVEALAVPTELRQKVLEQL